VKHTHWGVEYNTRGGRPKWTLSLQSIRRTRHAATQAALDHFCSLGVDEKDRWDEWHNLRNAGRLRAVKLTITKETT
jgi:hypothetical protein